MTQVANSANESSIVRMAEVARSPKTEPQRLARRGKPTGRSGQSHGLGVLALTMLAVAGLAPTDWPQFRFALHPTGGPWLASEDSDQIEQTCRAGDVTLYRRLIQGRAICCWMH